MRLFTLACLGFCTFGVLPTIVHAIDSKYAYDQATVAPKPSPRQKGTVMELSVYHSKYDGRVTKYSRTYSHWNGTTCASNNPAHKMKVLRVTYKGKSIDLLCIDTGGDKRLGYTRLDISGKAMKFFAPKWNGKDKGAPLLKGATVQVVK